MNNFANPPQKMKEFFPWFKKESEKKWINICLNKDIYGFQIQKGTKWLSGLTEQQIAEYEQEMNFSFPDIYKEFLKCMNGTNKETINIYGESGEPFRYGVGFYSFPRDIKLVKEMINRIYEEFKITESKVNSSKIPHIMPITEHRFLVMDRSKKNRVLSMWGTDVIPYSDSLNNFLLNDVLLGVIKDPQGIKNSSFGIKFWLK